MGFSRMSGRRLRLEQTPGRFNIRFNTPRAGRLLSLGLLVLGLLASGCGDDQDDVSRVQGRVLGSSNGALRDEPPSLKPLAVEGATVTLARVESDGSLATVSKASVQTDAEGDFTVETDLDGVRNLIVVAVKENAEFQAIVSARVERGATVACPPLDDETTVEARIYTWLVARGSGTLVTVADLTTTVSATLAAELKENVAARNTVGESLEEAARAHAAILADATFGVTSSEMEAIARARTEARAALEADLHAAGENGNLIEAAYDAHFAADMQAYTSNGVTASQLAKAREVVFTAMVKEAVTLNTAAELALKQSLSDLRARTIVHATEAHWVSLGATADQRQAIANAGVILRTSIRNASSEGGIDLAFETYHDAAVDGLQDILDAQAVAIASADIAVAAERVALAAAVELAQTIPALVSAYVEFFGEARTIVRTSLEGATETQLEACTETITMTSMML